MSEAFESILPPAGGHKDHGEVEMTFAAILETARQMEKRGAAFYERAAATARDAATAEIFLRLSRMEIDHRDIFEGLGEVLNKPGAMVPGRHHWPHLASMFLETLEADLEQRFAGLSDRERILRQAMEFEKDSVVFYAALREMLAREEDRRKVDVIIREETGHILWIGSQLATLR